MALPVPLPMASNDDQVEAHEDRIQRLEAGHIEVASQLSSQTVQISNLNSTVQRIESTLEKGLESVLEHVESMSKPLTAKIEKVMDLVETHSRDLSLIQKVEADRSQRWSLFKKVAVGFVLAISGAFLTKVGELLYTLLTKV